jgi:hypothetical protein
VPHKDHLPRHDDDELHNELTSKERIEAILSSKNLTVEQGVAAVEAQIRANDATFPHVVIVRVMESETPGGEPDCEFRFYYGPFRNRRVSEAWAKARFADEERITWEASRILTAEEDARVVERGRRIMEEAKKRRKGPGSI